MENKTDEEIVQSIRSGDTESFGVLIGRYEVKLKRYARKFLRQNEDIDDVIQEVFIKSYVNIKSFDVGKKFSPWLYRIAHNEFINLLKKRGESQLFFFDPDILFPHPVSPEKTDKIAENEEIKGILDEKLNGLPAKYREPVVLYYFEDMDYKEISEIMHMPISTVGVRLNRAKEILKSIIGKNYGK